MSKKKTQDAEQGIGTITLMKYISTYFYLTISLLFFMTVIILLSQMSSFSDGGRFAFILALLIFFGYLLTKTYKLQKDVIKYLKEM